MTETPKIAAAQPSASANQVSSIRIYRRLLRYLQPHRKRFMLAIVAMVIYGTTDGAVPFLIRSVLDDIFGAQNKQMLYLLPVVLMVFALVRGAFGFLQNYATACVGLGIIEDVRNDISRKLLKLPSRFFSQSSTGALIARMTNDTLLVRTALTDAVSAMLRDTVRVAALLCTAFYLDPVLAAVGFLGFPLCLYPIMKYGKRVRKFSRVGQEQFGGLTGLLQETIVGQKVVRSFCMEDFEYGRFQKENASLTATFKKAERYGAMTAPTNELIASFAIAGIILYGGLTVISGVRTQGDFIAFIISLFLMYDPLKKLGRVNNIVQLGVAAADRIFEVLDHPIEITDAPDAVEISPQRPRVEYRSVSFSYEKDSAQQPIWALKDISIAVEPGQTLALVGMSGGGKSTMVNLLPRFYDPQEGSISIDGLDIRKATLASLRRSIALVDQHTFLFNDTVYNNIVYGRFDATREEVIEAAKAASAHQFIQNLPQGYDTVIGEQGFRLSGGERARISIARALLKDAPILILDEATAALDSESEKLVQAAIERLMNGRTVLVIAHRLATIRRADKIAVIVGGRLVECGTHDELLQAAGEYAKLYNLQFHAQADESESLRPAASLLQ